jgi:hypothetical protein
MRCLVPEARSEGGLLHVPCGSGWRPNHGRNSHRRTTSVMTCSNWPMPHFALQKLDDTLAFMFKRQLPHHVTACAADRLARQRVYAELVQAAARHDPSIVA